MPKPATRSKPPTSLSLLCLSAGAVDRASGELVAASLPTSLILLPWGTHDLGKRGVAHCDEVTLASFEAAMAALKLNDGIFIDFNHNSLPGHPAYLAEKEPRFKAARGKVKVVRGIGIVASALSWTPEGRDAFLGGHFQDISPAIFRDKGNHVIAIHSAALCDHGEVDGLTIEAATAPPELQSAFAALSTITPSLQPSTTPPSQHPMKPELLAALAALLKGMDIELAAEPDDTMLADALTAAASKLDDMKAKLTASATPLEKKEEVKPDALSAQITDLQAQLATIRAEKDQARRDALIAEAIRDGKIIPLTSDLWNKAPVEVCQGLVAAAKAGEVPLKSKTPEGEQTEAKPLALSAEVMSNMGLTAEDLAKYGPQDASAA